MMMIVNVGHTRDIRARCNVIRQSTLNVCCAVNSLPPS